MQLSLLVLRAREPLGLARFYEQFGCKFELERHGSGPEHYASSNGDAVFEIYPSKTKRSNTRAVRVGFRVGDIDAACARALAHDGTLVKPPSPGKWGRRAVLKDPEGHTVELMETRHG